MNDENNEFIEKIKILFNEEVVNDFFTLERELLNTLDNPNGYVQSNEDQILNIDLYTNGLIPWLIGDFENRIINWFLFINRNLIAGNYILNDDYYNKLNDSLTFLKEHPIDVPFTTALRNNCNQNDTYIENDIVLLLIDVKNRIVESINILLFLLDLILNHKNSYIQIVKKIEKFIKTEDNFFQDTKIGNYLQLFEINCIVVLFDHGRYRNGINSFVQELLYFSQRITEIGDKFNDNDEAKEIFEIIKEKNNFILLKVVRSNKNSDRFSNIQKSIDSNFYYLKDFYRNYELLDDAKSNHISERAILAKEFKKTLNEKGSQYDLIDFIIFLKHKKYDHHNIDSQKKYTHEFLKRSDNENYNSKYDHDAYNILCGYVKNNLLTTVIDEKNETEIYNTYKDIIVHINETKIYNYFPHLKIAHYYCDILNKQELEILKQFLNKLNSAILELEKSLSWCIAKDHFPVIFPASESVKKIAGQHIVGTLEIFLFSSVFSKIDYEEIAVELEFIKIKRMYLIGLKDHYKRIKKVQEDTEKTRNVVISIKEDLEKNDKKNIEILSLFTAVISFFLGSGIIVANAPANSNTFLLSLIFVSGLLVFVSGIYFLNRGSKTSKTGRVIFIISILLIVSAIIMFIVENRLFQ